MRNLHYRRCNVARNSETGENEKCTLSYMEYEKKTEKRGK